MAALPIALAASLAAATAVQPAQSARDLTLDEALRLARASNPEYLAALARTDAAAPGRLASWGAFLPSLDARLGLSRYDVRNITFLEPEGSAARLPEALETTTFSASQGLDLRWQIFDGGRRFFELGRARAAGRAGDRAAEAARVVLEGDVKTQYLEVLKQEAIAKLARELLEARRRDVDAAEARFRIATASESDLLGARIEASRQEAALFDAEAEAAKAREALAVLLGIPDLDGYRVRDTFSEEDLDPARFDLDALSAKSALHPVVLHREAELDAASRTTWIRRSAYLPSLWLSLGLSRSETQGAEGDFVVLDPENRSTFLSIGASWSLFDGFQRQVENARAGAERDAARHAAAQARREQEAAIRNAHRDLQSAHRRLRLAGESLDLARRRVQIARERYRLGSAEMPFWALQEVLRQATEAEREAVAARYDYLKAVAHLEGAVGEPLASWTGTSP